MINKRLLFTLSLAIISSHFFIACTKKSQQSETFMQAKVDGTKLNTNSCELYQNRPDTSYWIVDGYSYKNIPSYPVIYPRIQLWLTKFRHTIGTYNIGTDSVTAFYYPNATDTIQAISGVIDVTYVYTFVCGGIKGVFNLTLMNGTVITNGTFVTGPICGLL